MEMQRERERESVMYTHGTGTYIISLADNELSIIFRIYIYLKTINAMNKEMLCFKV